MTFYNLYFYLLITNLQLTEIEWCFEMFYFFTFRS